MTKRAKCLRAKSFYLNEDICFDSLITIYYLPKLTFSFYILAFSYLLDPRTAAIKIVDQAEVNNNEYCYSCVKIDNICYKHTYLFELPAPFGEQYPIIEKIGVVNFTNVIFFTFEPNPSDKEYSKVGYISLYHPEFSGVISGSQSFNFRPFDIDQREKKVYLGGSDGIWVVDDINYSPTYFTVKANLITNVVVKDYVYFTAYNRKGIFKYVAGYYVVYLADKMINNFVLDVEYNIVYLTVNGLFISFHNKMQNDVQLSTEPWMRGLTVDTKGTVYAWHINGIYKVTVGKVPSESTLKRITRIAPDAMAFDESNNIIYSIRKKLYKLTKVATSKCFGR
ncbi:uncharacterized protein LOC133525284 [Cydia pomonella]|uniref:uncharacterized protein LOC133525284 n=1 Tax=Cydia pomonella TaxID=82600 RepID=UPI002ADE60AB|nr:uncharacterized protein LOC133525284 [Cydia pomonella]